MINYIPKINVINFRPVSGKDVTAKAWAKSIHLPEPDSPKQELIVTWQIDYYETRTVIRDGEEVELMVQIDNNNDVRYYVELIADNTIPVDVNGLPLVTIVDGRRVGDWDNINGLMWDLDDDGIEEHAVGQLDFIFDALAKGANLITMLIGDFQYQDYYDKRFAK